MKYIITIFLLTISSLIVKGDKIEKKLIIGRSSDCKGLAFNCKSSTSPSVSADILYNEPKSGDFYIEFTENDIKSNSTLNHLFTNHNECILEEDWIIPEQIINELNITTFKVVKKGVYKILNHENLYTIVISHSN